MKPLLISLGMMSAFGAFAQERITLNSSSTTILGSEAILIRTAQTPEKVTLTLHVPMTYTVCTKYVRVHRPRGQSYNRCVASKLVTSIESDRMKLSFKDLSALGGSEAESFRVSAKQRKVDSLNVNYDITPLETMASYKVVKRGVLGFDSFAIGLK